MRKREQHRVDRELLKELATDMVSALNEENRAHFKTVLISKVMRYEYVFTLDAIDYVERLLDEIVLTPQSRKKRNTLRDEHERNMGRMGDRAFPRPIKKRLRRESGAISMSSSATPVWPPKPHSSDAWT